MSDEGNDNPPPPPVKAPPVKISKGNPAGDSRETKEGKK